MKTAVFTSSALRHRAFAKMCLENPRLNVDLIVYEKATEVSQQLTQRPCDMTTKHMHMRQIYEQDFFGLYLSNESALPSGAFYMDRGWISTDECLTQLRSRRISQILVYGTSILKGTILQEYNNKILNLHLGLSPYYRGSGTNYFPFVNNAPEYCGATIMYLDAGIDTGPIIHQLRPRINPSDTFHQLSNRFLIDAFKAYIDISELNLFSPLPLPAHNSIPGNYNQTRLLYKRRDFTESSVQQLYDNFNSGMIETYLDSYTSRTTTVPIITHIPSN